MSDEPVTLTPQARAAKVVRRVYLGPQAQTNRLRRGVRASMLGLLTLSILTAPFSDSQPATEPAADRKPAVAAVQAEPSSSSAAAPAPSEASADPSPAALPEPSELAPPPAPPTTDQVIAQTEQNTALAALATVPVKGRAPKTGYDRDRFGPAWADTDRNGCDTRNDMLARDLADETFKAGTSSCVVLNGKLLDPYTGRTLTFTKADANAIQIDHVVALSNAWQTGAQHWPAEKRLAFANDPLNLLAVDGPTNGSKGDGDAATWLPPNKSYRCSMVARQVAVKVKYALWMTAAERDASARVLSECPREPAPTGGNPTFAPVAAPKPPPPAPPAPAPAAPAQRPPAPPPAASSDQGVVHPGAFCSPSGATGRTRTGTRMVCGTTAKSPDRARWHKP
jgi:hypothetical protein